MTTAADGGRHDRLTIGLSPAGAWPKGHSRRRPDSSCRGTTLREHLAPDA